MSISSIGAGLSNTYTLLQAANEEKALREQAAENSSKTASSSTGIGTNITKLLESVPKGDDERLSFQDVDDYREELGDKWDKKVMADLKKLGIDVTQNLAMSYDAETGKVTVADGTEGKEIIDKYFEDNPDVVSQFYDIVQLGKLTSTAGSKLTQTQFNQNIQLQTMSWWCQNNVSAQSWFSGGGLLGLQGMTGGYTGLDLRV
ncbi:hypothetical protein [Pseudodesulfovibrio sp.]|uniref:hypothetical protein n=1 Tax=unclassified Pseudodesulfovibrio TaxID=2661612 RepID=UPI003B00FE4C